MLAADVVEEDVDALGGRRRELLRDRAVVVVEGGGEPELEVSQRTLSGVPALPTTREAPRSRAN